jgi:hypothetical protein
MPRVIKRAVVMPAPVTNEEKCSLPGPVPVNEGTSSMCRLSSRGKEGARPGGEEGVRVLDVLGEAGGEEGGKGSGAEGVFGEVLSARRFCRGDTRSAEAGGGWRNERATATLSCRVPLHHHPGGASQAATADKGSMCAVVPQGAHTHILVSRPEEGGATRHPRLTHGVRTHANTNTHTCLTHSYIYVQAKTAQVWSSYPNSAGPPRERLNALGWTAA